MRVPWPLTLGCGPQLALPWPLSQPSPLCCQYFETDPIWGKLVFDLGRAANFFGRISEASARFDTAGLPRAAEGQRKVRLSSVSGFRGHGGGWGEVSEV